MKEIPPFFISMATAAKFVLTIPNFLAYLVSLAVDVVLLSGDVLLFYVSFSLLLLLLFLLLLFFHTFLSALFLGDTLIKLYETL
jgi:hypothetical protein